MFDNHNAMNRKKRVVRIPNPIFIGPIAKRLIGQNKYKTCPVKKPIFATIINISNFPPFPPCHKWKRLPNRDAEMIIKI